MVFFSLTSSISLLSRLSSSHSYYPTPWASPPHLTTFSHDPKKKGPIRNTSCELHTLALSALRTITGGPSHPVSPRDHSSSGLLTQTGGNVVLMVRVAAD